MSLNLQRALCLWSWMRVELPLVTLFGVLLASLHAMMPLYKRRNRPSLKLAEGRYRKRCVDIIPAGG